MDKKKVSILIIYILLSIGIIAFIPHLINFSPSGDSISNTFWKSSAGYGISKLLQIIIAIILIIVPFVVLKDSAGSSIGGIFKKNTVDQGTAKKGTISELKGLTIPIESKKGGGYTLSKNVRLSSEKSYEHVAIIGPTGSGKSTSFFIPTLLDADGTYSFVVTDPKGELCNITSPYLKSLGMNIVKLTPLKPKENPFFYNPLLVAETNTQIRELAQLILVNGSKAIELQMGSSGGGGDQASWINMAIPLFTASLAYAKKYGKKKTISEAIDIVLDMGIDKKSLDKAEELFKQDEISLKNFKIFKSAGGSDKTISSIKSVLSSNIQLFLDENISEFTKTPFTLSTSTGQLVIDNNKLFDPRLLREKPTALFVCVEEIKSDYVAPLMSVFYSQLLDLCMSNFNDKYKTPVLFMLDEFANIGVIPTISKIAATARSRKIGISIGLQGVEQLKRNYGEDNANDILNNLKSKVFFSGLTGDSAKYASDLAGFGTVESKNYSTGDSGSQDFLSGLFKGPNVSVSGVRRELYTPDEIRRLADDKVLIIAHNRNPVQDNKNTYYTQNRYKKKLKK